MAHFKIMDSINNRLKFVIITYLKKGPLLNYHKVTITKNVINVNEKQQIILLET